MAPRSPNPHRSSGEVEPRLIDKLMDGTAIAAVCGDAEKYEGESQRYWNKFYLRNETRFFKDRCGPRDVPVLKTCAISGLL